MHPVERKLHHLVAYIVSVEKLRRKSFYIGFIIYSYIRDIAAAIVGMGITFPLLPVIADKGEGANVTAAIASVSMPGWLKVVTLTAAVAWVLLRVVVIREQWEKRGTLAGNCINQFSLLQGRMRRAVQEADPLPELIDVHKQMMAQIDRAKQENAYPFPEFAENIDEEVKRRVRKLVEEEEHNWAPAPVRQRRGGAPVGYPRREDRNG